MNAESIQFKCKRELPKHWEHKGKPHTGRAENPKQTQPKKILTQTQCCHAFLNWTQRILKQLYIYNDQIAYRGKPTINFSEETFQARREWKWSDIFQILKQTNKKFSTQNNTSSKLSFVLENEITNKVKINQQRGRKSLHITLQIGG